MIARTIVLLAACAALAACNSKSPEPTENSTASPDLTTPTSAAPAPAAAAMKPAPDGLPSRIAREVIAASKQNCAAVAKADRNAQDGTITASCTSGENYRVYTAEDGGPVAVPM